MGPHTSVPHTRTLSTQVEVALSGIPKDPTLVRPENKRETPSCTTRRNPSINTRHAQHRHDLIKADSEAELSSKCVGLIWDNKRQQSKTMNNRLGPIQTSEADLAGLDQAFLERRGSTGSIVSTTSSPGSSPSAASSGGSPCSETPWKRQREDIPDQSVSITLPPALRPSYGKSKRHLVADVDLSTELETLKYKFLAYEISSQSLPSSSSPFENRPRTIPLSVDVVAGDNVHLCGDDRGRSTNEQLEGNTFPDQCSSSNFVTAPVTHPAGFQSGILRSSTILGSTGRSECAYIPIACDDHSLVPQSTHNHLPHVQLHHQHTSPGISPCVADVAAYRYSTHTSLANDNNRSRGYLMDRHTDVDHSFTSFVPQKIALEDLTFYLTCSKQTRDPGSIHCTTTGDALPAKAARINHSELPSRYEFTVAIDAYLSTLSSKKLPKALITQRLYGDIIFNLKREQDSLPGIGTPQFRFWCRKHFVLKTIPRLRLREQTEIPHSAIALPIGNQDDGDSGEVEVVIHDGQPVVTRENIYNVLIRCHTLANHAGRDKTTAIVKQNYSWVPKVLIGDFVKLCPVCCSKKVSGATWAHLHRKSDLTPLG